MSESNQIQYDCWSSNGEQYYSDIDSVLDDLSVGDTIYEGVQQTPKVKNWVDPDRVIDDIQSQVWDEHGEYSEDYLNNVTSEAKAELKQLIVCWLEKYGEPTFYTVDHVLERAVTEEDFA